MKTNRKIERLDQEIFKPLATEELKTVTAGAAATWQISGTYGSSGGDASGSVDF